MMSYTAKAFQHALYRERFAPTTRAKCVDVSLFLKTIEEWESRT